ncbi:hypothetical protein BD780_001660 [Clostridium tetanomorphum]|uniref:DUF2892 domain-containing protein n=1 Tax=Clostridium tetanomorphum TaxID=1553 RepID=A0A923IZJ6_CLOTT|nr:DUF2892 domain-containing protein [Clostridium tetanomorphum]KAJ49244.1 hypothetical protein CTM_24111 [Clostridium tetanomorphum DSM 665]KAJ52732.1 hypothetical protein CTM_07101 [Clostridium tetanomorphum DSM 665]MBC2396714.1 DUF2892 domain-containing protein [Clostridium tetanomorphum]MBP1863327.1 hypothetical protein [Clostridium tetanomorphum]NRS84435.1 hypothetical protein [Clostridium tetanomorphum]
MFSFPDTTKRVELNTDKYINEKIRKRTLKNIEYYTNKENEEIISRIKKLNKEWDIERLLEANAASAVILSTILGFKVNKKWFYISSIVGGFLLQHALQGWCPPVPIFRRLGVRTSSEIDYEKEILEKLLKAHGGY